MSGLFSRSRDPSPLPLGKMSDINFEWSRLRNALFFRNQSLLRVGLRSLDPQCNVRNAQLLVWHPKFVEGWSRLIPHQVATKKHKSTKRCAKSWDFILHDKITTVFDTQNTLRVCHDLCNVRNTQVCSASKLLSVGNGCVWTRIQKNAEGKTVYDPRWETCATLFDIHNSLRIGFDYRFLEVATNTQKLKKMREVRDPRCEKCAFFGIQNLWRDGHFSDRTRLQQKLQQGTIGNVVECTMYNVVWHLRAACNCFGAKLEQKRETQKECRISEIGWLQCE